MDASPGSQARQLPTETIEQQPEPRRTPSLLPAFEPLSSSPFPRPRSGKRKFQEDSPTFPKQQLRYYPTPVPTSSTGFLPSSPGQNGRPGLSRTISTLSERVPLGAVPSVDIPANGEIVRMGRSSNSSDFQLSSNRLISRVHVQASYHAPDAEMPQGRIELECLGWNGAKVHCKGRIFELRKGDVYVAENPMAEIMLDVQDTRVMIVWPNTASGRKLSWDSEDETTPTRRTVTDHFASSPPIVPRSPVSQSPMRQPDFGLASNTPGALPVQVFEDPDSDPVDDMPNRDAADATFIRPSLAHSDPAPASKAKDVKASFYSSFGSDDFSDNDAENEENDPVVHSFGPFGENILPRLASFSTATPKGGLGSAQRRRRAPFASRSPQRSSSESIRFKESPVKNHVINQLAFSRVHSLPLSAIHTNLPAELKACIKEPAGDNESDQSSSSKDSSKTAPQLSKQDLKKLMDQIACVGEIPRSGKDAAGKPLENEFYYVPEMDTNEARRENVTSGMRGSGLRAVRKQHKVGPITPLSRLFASLNMSSPVP